MPFSVEAAKLWVYWRIALALDKDKYYQNCYECISNGC